MDMNLAGRTVLITGGSGPADRTSYVTATVISMDRAATATVV